MTDINKEESKLEPYKIMSSKFIGGRIGHFTYEITFNQSIVHTGRFAGIEKGLDEYRYKEEKEYEEDIINQAKEILEKREKNKNNL